MSARFETAPGVRLPPNTDFFSVSGEPVAVSASSETIRIRLEDAVYYVKRHHYSFGRALRLAFRSTLFGASRARREYRALGRFAAVAGPDVVPSRVGFGERRTLLLLRGDVLVTAGADGESLETLSPGRNRAREIGTWLARLHRAGLTHGRLFSRNVLVPRNGPPILLDLDRARSGGHPFPVPDSVRDLAFLCESIPWSGRSRMLRALAAYRREGGSPAREILRQDCFETARAEARWRLARRRSRA